MRQKLVYQAPSEEIIDLVLMGSPLCSSDFDYSTGDESGLDDFEYEVW